MHRQIDLKRYQRHLSLPDFDEEAQEKLIASKVLVVGCGGLGNPVSLYLAAAGIGTIGLIDDDKVSLSNLQRQIIYTESDLGKYKAELTSSRLNALNSSINSVAILQKLTSENAINLLEDYDLVIDCTDNFPTRYLINDACEILNKPFIYGSIYQYEGQVSVFNFDNGCTYRDVFPEPPQPNAVPNCEVGGVLGSLAGIIGTMQANEAIKVISGIGEILKNKLFIFDAWAMQSKTIKLQKPTERKEIKEIKELIDYQEFCKTVDIMVKEVSVNELHQMMEKKEDFQLIDVREPHEADIATLDGELIPLGTVPDNIDKVASDKKVIVHCRSGARSAQAIQFLQTKGDFDLYNLKGGILAWADEIDPSMAKY